MSDDMLGKMEAMPVSKTVRSLGPSWDKSEPVKPKSNYRIISWLTRLFSLCGEN
jgi:hypothetical protein